MHHGIIIEAIVWPCSFQIQFRKIRPLIFVNIFNFCSFESYVYTWMQIAVAASDILFYDHFKFDLSVLKKIWVLIIAKKNNSLNTVLTVSVCENVGWQVYFNEVSIHLWYFPLGSMFRYMMMYPQRGWLLQYNLKYSETSIMQCPGIGQSSLILFF